MVFRILLALLLAAPAAAAPPPIEAIGPWSLICHRADNLGGRAFERCAASAILGSAGVSVERDARGLVGFLTTGSCKTSAKGVFRLEARALAVGPKRAVKFAKAVNTALRQCGQPEQPFDAGIAERLLKATDGLSAEWVG
jgi:hypothetical protein